MLKLTLAYNRGPILLNPAHIVAVLDSTANPITFVHMSDGKVYEVREAVAAIFAKFPAGGSV